MTEIARPLGEWDVPEPAETPVHSPDAEPVPASRRRRPVRGRIGRATCPVYAGYRAFQFQCGRTFLAARRQGHHLARSQAVPPLAAQRLIVARLALSTARCSTPAWRPLAAPLQCDASRVETVEAALAEPTATPSSAAASRVAARPVLLRE